MFTQAIAVSPAALEEHRRLVGELGRLCGLTPGITADRCGRSGCSYFDASLGTCGLLVWDVPARVPSAALGWLVAHRRFENVAADESLAARCASL